MQVSVGHVLLPPAGGPKSVVLGMLSRNVGPAPMPEKR